MDISKDAQDQIVERVDKYMVSLSSKHKPTLVIRVTEDQERRIRQLTPAQLRNFRTVMGG